MSTLSISSFDQFKNDDGSYSINVEKFREIIRGGGKMKRPMSGYFLWLNKERVNIRNTYFDDYDKVENWDSETLQTYFENKGLDKPKKEGKPRIVSLVTMKAGKMWKEMSAEEKKPFLEKAEKLKEDYRKIKGMESDFNSTEKVMDETPDDSCKNDNSDTEEMDVVEYKYKGVVYYHDEEKGNIYDVETGNKVAKMIDGKFTPIEG